LTLLANEIVVLLNVLSTGGSEKRLENQKISIFDLLLMIFYNFFCSSDREFQALQDSEKTFEKNTHHVFTAAIK
jgi:hypothetical protein